MAAALVEGASAQDDASARYSAVLQEISNMKLAIAHKQLQIKTQEAEIASLGEQIKSIPDVKKAVPPMLQVMASEMRKQISTDIPFKLEERNDRIGAFEDSISKGSEASIGEQMRRALSLYSIEMGYGSNVEAYAGDNPFEEKSGARYNACLENLESSSCGLDEDQMKAVNNNIPLADLQGQLLDGDYLRYGRLALVYMQHDGTEAYRYDDRQKTWESLDGNQMLEIRRAVRMAKGESAPAVISAPLYAR